MKKLLSLLLLIAAGLGLGGAGAWGVLRFMPKPPATAAIPPVRYVTAPVLAIPVVAKDGRLSGYVQITFQIETDEAHEAVVAADMPRFLDAVNRAAWATPIASGPDGLLPDPRRAGALGLVAAKKAHGKHSKARVKRVLASEIRPL